MAGKLKIQQQQDILAETWKSYMKDLDTFYTDATCYESQVDGISFIEKLLHNAFNESTQLEHYIKMHKKLYKVDVKKIGGDTTYAGSANRTIYKEIGIQTSFAKRNRPSTEKQEKDFVRQELSRVMATVKEGTFSTQKEH